MHVAVRALKLKLKRFRTFSNGLNIGSEFDGADFRVIDLSAEHQWHHHWAHDFQLFVVARNQ